MNNDLRQMFGATRNFPGGVPQMNRIPRRALQYNDKFYTKKKDDGLPSFSERSDKQKAPTAAWKTKQKQPIPAKSDAHTVQDKTEITARVMKVSKEKLVDEPLWMEGPMQGSQPVQRMYALNSLCWQSNELCSTGN